MNEKESVHIQVESELVKAAGITDVGLIRNENQDSIYLDENGKIFLLADGMGGHERGAEASREIMDVLPDFFQPDRIRREMNDITAADGVPIEVSAILSLAEKGIRKSNSLLYKKNCREHVERHMGATLTGLVLTSELYAAWFHVGDSRLYRWRDTTLTQLTEDHSAYNEWVKKGSRGEEPSKSIITRAIGPKDSTIPDMNWDKSQKNDIYLLCSDGLSDLVENEDMSDIIKNSETPDKIAKNLLNAALNAGGSDNISIIACRI